MYVVVFAGKLPEALISSLPKELKREVTPIKVKNRGIINRIIARKHHKLSKKLDRLMMLPFGAIIQFKVCRKWKNRGLENLIDLSKHSINSHVVGNSINSLSPKSVILVGTELLDTNHSISCTSLFNLHSGMSPTYRGFWNWFWPSYLRDFENNGVTIHSLESRADSGSILIQEKYTTSSKNSLEELVLMSLLAQRDILIKFLSGISYPPDSVNPSQGKHLFEPGISELFLLKMNRHKW